MFELAFTILLMSFTNEDIVDHCAFLAHQPIHAEPFAELVYNDICDDEAVQQYVLEIKRGY